MRVFDRISLSLEFVIRECTEHDLPQLEWLGSLSSHRAFMRRQFTRHLRGVNVMLVADLAGYPVGQVWVDLEQWANSGGALIWALRVIDPLRNFGLGTKLLAAAEGVAEDAGRLFVELGVEKANERGRALYERLGYVAVGEELCEEDYVAPDGRIVRQVFDQAVLRKSLGGEIPTRA